MIEQKKEGLESVISYAVGGGGLSIGFLAQYEPQINFFILVFSLLVVFIRLAHDGVKFFDYMKNRKNK